MTPPQSSTQTLTPLKRRQNPMSFLFKKKSLPESLQIALASPRLPLMDRSLGFVWRIAKGLVQQGHEVSLFCDFNPLGEEEWTQEGVNIYCKKSSWNQKQQAYGGPDSMWKRFRELHQKRPYHILHSFSHPIGSLAEDRKNLGLALAYDIRATQLPQIFSLMGDGDGVINHITTSLKVLYGFLKTFYLKDRHLIKSADGIFVQSPNQKLALERYYLYPEKKIFQIPFGVDMSELSPRSNSQEYLKKMNIPPSATIALSISDMTEKRDMVNILQAFQKVVVKKPSSYLIVVGEGPAFKEIEREMLQMALGGHVILTKSVKTHEVSNYIELAQVFLTLSPRTTGGELNLFEAMVREKIVIGSQVGPTANLIEDGVDGFLLRPADTQALSHLLLGLFSGDIPKETLVQRARKKALNFFDNKKMVQETLEAYKKILLQTPWATCIDHSIQLFPHP